MTLPPIKIPYSPVKNGKRYWQLGEERQKATGLDPSVLPASEALGDDTFPAQRKALAYYDAYKAAMQAPAEDRLGGYSPGTLGAVYVLWKRTEDWEEKAERTRDEYDYLWKRYIEKEFARTLITRITVSDSEGFHRKCRKTLSASEAHRTLKIWRALLSMLEKKHLIDKAPIGAVTNPQPKGRSQFWLEAEVCKLQRACKLLKWDAMGLIIRLAWETAMSPPDCRTFALSMLKQDRSGWYIERGRTKTSKGVMAPVSDQLVEDLKAYGQRWAEERRLELMPTQPLFRNSRGRAYTKSFMAHEFADIRRVAFGKAERRQFGDIRRSANLEADLGGAAPSDRAALLANALDKNKALDGVYTPVTVARARKAQEARGSGRDLLQQEVGRKAK